jgi:hypothetical protein
MGLLVGGALVRPSPAAARVLERIAAAPDALASDERAALAAAVEVILPATDTPGAREAGVPAFIEHMLAGWFEPAERDSFRAGLARLDRMARERGGTAFAAADEAHQIEILTALEQEALAQGGGASLITGYRIPTAPPAAFFTALKELVLIGYYTSEIGATRELHWNPVPGRFDPCVHRAPPGDAGG